MQRILVSLLLLLLGAAVSAASASPRVQISGDPAIDAQWEVLLASSANPVGSNPVNPNAMEPTGIFRMFRLGGSEPSTAPRQQQQPQAQAHYRTQRMDPRYLPAVVNYESNERPGTIIIDTGSRYLYRVLGDGRAQRYGVGVGREGFGWTGRVHVARKAEWPTWTPPAEMRRRQPYLPVSMAGGPDNPLGARALYLYDGGRDTLFRIHGSNAPWTIGHAVSSGCIRMRNEDVIALYNVTGIGTTVIVR